MSVDDFVLAVITAGERARRKCRLEGGLPGEVHQIGVEHAFLNAFKCSHCTNWNSLKPVVVRPAYGHSGVKVVPLLKCASCGDVTRVVWLSA